MVYFLESVLKIFAEIHLFVSIFFLWMPVLAKVGFEVQFFVKRSIDLEVQILSIIRNNSEALPILYLFH